MRRKNTKIAATTRTTLSASENVVEPMDEDEQQALVNKLDKETTQQQVHIDQAFRYLCITAAISCIMCTAYVHQTSKNKSTNDNGNESSRKTNHLTLFRWTHGILASLLHIISIRIVLIRTRNLNVWTCHLPITFNLLLASVALFSARSLKSSKTDDLLLTMAADDENNAEQNAIFLHYGLVISNLLVLCAALLLRWDAQSTEKAIQELKDSRYRHKSL